MKTPVKVFAIKPYYPSSLDEDFPSSFFYGLFRFPQYPSLLPLSKKDDCIISCSVFEKFPPGVTAAAGPGVDARIDSKVDSDVVDPLPLIPAKEIIALNHVPDRIRSRLAARGCGVDAVGSDVLPVTALEYGS
jgi:hypothetical protein